MTENEKIKPHPDLSLPEGAIPFWEDVAQMRAPEDWDEQSLFWATVLANTLYLLQLVQNEIEQEGAMVKDKRGNSGVNPKQRRVDALIRRAANCQSLLRPTETTLAPAPEPEAPVPTAPAPEAHGGLRVIRGDRHDKDKKGKPE